MKRYLFRAAFAASILFLSAIVVGFVPARAADLGGNCCSDLEERIAELEATTARKDTRKVGVTIYGQVSKAMMWAGGDANDGVVIDNPNSGTRFGFTGTGKIDRLTSVGYRIEIGAGDGLAIRHAHIWLEGSGGKVTLGRASTATDGISEIALANTNLANLPSAIYGIVVDGSRKDVVRYDTPSFGGLVGSVSYAGDNTFEGAARFVAEFSGVRFSAGIGYADEASALSRVSGSAALMHVSTGMFVGFTAGHLKSGSDSAKAAHVTLGIEQRFNTLGRTTVFGEFGRLSLNDDAGTGYGFGIAQSIDAVAADMFASFRRIEDADANVVMIGSRIRF